MGLGPSPGVDGEAVQETLGGRRWENLYSWVTEVGYAQIKKQISNSPTFLSVRWRFLVMCRSRAAFYGQPCESVHP